MFKVVSIKVQSRKALSSTVKGAAHQILKIIAR